eukprot:gnl/TRDRNA2_/TRDRNA2_175410_c0_seq1.p1 gnl/TRDRNA2_/TRDRNA2_175410_c0~~gnl/TRDRNA2_/TRDRNA2_175410_c0_seq1.p1  ORF type:complete len:523 (+),score=106.01 gnl/TRDRNA2_/TRDRNA2_175410_c0_seq1:89-1657(+)
MVLGLFAPEPSFPPHAYDLNYMLHIFPSTAIFVFMIASIVGGAVAFSIPFILVNGFWFLPFVLLLVANHFRVVAKKWADNKADDKEDKQIEVDHDWRKHHKMYFSTQNAHAQSRRHAEADNILSRVNPGNAPTFNTYVGNVENMAIYGCGILAATHVGGLAALERHGLQYRKLKNLAGVSAGSVVVAMIAVGYNATELFDLIQKLPFPTLGYPELGSIVRAFMKICQTVCDKIFGSFVSHFFHSFVSEQGPGINSGAALEKMIGDALKAKTGDANITLNQVKERYGKRVVIIVTELDSGRERQLTPEADPNLPLKMAVRMSMGVPGLMECFGYDGHVYVDGGMCNDFPMSALPEENRIGLMVRPSSWIAYNMNGLANMISPAEMAKETILREFLDTEWHKLQEGGLYPTADPLELMATCMNTMMDANLMLQIKYAAHGQNKKITQLAPEVLTLCSGKCDPFDFGMTKAMHKNLFQAGQLLCHMHASYVDAGYGEFWSKMMGKTVMAEEDRMKTVLLLAHLDP